MKLTVNLRNQTLQVIADDPGKISVGDDGRGALIFAKLGQNAMRDGDRNTDLLKRLGDGPLIDRIGKGEKQRDRDGLGARGPNSLRELGEGERVGRFEKLAFCTDAFLYPETKIGGNEAIGRGLKPVIEPGARLTTDGDGVFKAGGSHKGNPRALALE